LPNSPQQREFIYAARKAAPQRSMQNVSHAAPASLNAGRTRQRERTLAQ
jgi:hypothetical protein